MSLDSRVADGALSAVALPVAKSISGCQAFKGGYLKPVRNGSEGSAELCGPGLKLIVSSLPYVLL